MAIRIHHIDLNKSYIAETRDDCELQVEKSAYDEAIRLQQVITMGKIIAEPIKAIRINKNRCRRLGRQKNDE